MSVAERIYPTPRYPVPFDWADAQAAGEAWGCNCGPAAIAAVTGLSLDALRPHLFDFEQKRYTNPTLMFDILRELRSRFRIQHGRLQLPKLEEDDGFLRSHYCFPAWGLARIQWEGPWTAPGVPMPVRYRKTHWVGSEQDSLGKMNVFDVNAISVGGWLSFHEWSEELVPWLCEKCVPDWNGRWHVTHAIEIIRPALRPPRRG